MASSVLIFFSTHYGEMNDDEASLSVSLLVPVFLGFAIRRKKNFARIIVGFGSTLLFSLLCLILILGFIYGTDGVTYGLGSLIQVTDPTIIQHVTLGILFAVWFGMPAFLLATKPVRAEFENESSRSRRSWSTHFTR
jgi:hypothetical protein